MIEQPFIICRSERYKKLLKEFENFQYPWPERDPDKPICIEDFRNLRVAIDAHDHWLDSWRYCMFMEQAKISMTRWQRIKMWFRHRYYWCKCRILKLLRK